MVGLTKIALQEERLTDGNLQCVLRFSSIYYNYLMASIIMQIMRNWLPRIILLSWPFIMHDVYQLWSLSSYVVSHPTLTQSSNVQLRWRFKLATKTWSTCQEGHRASTYTCTWSYHGRSFSWGSWRLYILANLTVWLETVGHYRRSCILKQECTKYSVQ